MLTGKKAQTLATARALAVETKLIKGRNLTEIEITHKQIGLFYEIFIFIFSATKLQNSDYICKFLYTFFSEFVLNFGLIYHIYHYIYHYRNTCKQRLFDALCMMIHQK